MKELIKIIFLDSKLKKITLFLGYSIKLFVKSSAMEYFLCKIFMATSATVNIMEGSMILASLVKYGRVAGVAKVIF